MIGLSNRGRPIHAVRTGHISITPIHFDLTDLEGIERLGAWDLDELAWLNVVAYQKRIKNFGDKDQFFDTGVIFPISISRDRVPTGIEVLWIMVFPLVVSRAAP